MICSKITLNSLLCMMTFYSQCYGSNNPFDSVVSEVSKNKNSSNLQPLIYTPKPQERDKLSSASELGSFSSFSQTETASSSTNPLEHNALPACDRSSSSVPLSIEISSKPERKSLGISRHRSSSCSSRIGTPKSSDNNPAAPYPPRKDTDGFPTVTLNEKSSSTAELRVPLSVNPNRNSVRITPKEKEEFLAKRHSKRIPAPFDIPDDTSSPQPASTSNGSVISHEDIINHSTHRTPLFSQQHIPPYPVQYMPVAPIYPQYMHLPSYPTQFPPPYPYTPRYMASPSAQRGRQNANGLPLNYGGNSPSPSSGVLSLLSRTMTPFELMDVSQNSPDSNGSRLKHGGNPPSQSSEVLSHSSLRRTLPLHSSHSNIFKPRYTRSSTVTSANHTENPSDENGSQDELLEITQRQHSSGRTTPSSSQQTVSVSPIDSQSDLSPENSVVSSKHGIKSFPKSPITHIYSNTSHELVHHNGDNIIKWPHAHIYSNTSPELVHHNGDNTIFCDPPRVGEGEEFDTMDPIMATHNPLTRTYSTDNKRLAGERRETVERSESANLHGRNGNAQYSKNYDNCKVVLSVDGGGVRGIMPAIILRNVYEKLGEDFKFDVMAGTSVGALVVASFALGKIDHFINDYNAIAKMIFTRNWSLWNPLNWFSITRGLLGPAYRVDSKEQAVRDFTGKKDESAYSFDSLGTRLLLPFYLQQNNNVAFYKNYDEISNPNVHKYNIIDSLMATTAAPTFFNPHVFRGLDGCRYEGIDGGVFANNPALVAYQEARLLFPKSRIILLSLGTGDHNYMDPNLESTDRGNLFWAKKYSTVTNSAMTAYTHQSLTEKSSVGKLDYFRVNPHLMQYLCNSMDNTSPANIERLETYANRSIADSKDLHNFVEKVRTVKQINAQK